MECKDYQDLLIQLPYNELDEEETILLKDHLKSCEKCSAELKRNVQLFELTRKLGAHIPEDHEKQETINSILNKVKSPEKLQTRQHINYRIIRVLINTAAVFLIGLFLFQQMEMKRNLESLNDKVQSHKYSYPNNDESIELEITSFLENTALQKHLNIPEEQVLEIIKNYQQIKKENSAILEYLQSNYPEVFNELQRKLKESQNPTRKL